MTWIVEATFTWTFDNEELAIEFQTGIEHEAASEMEGAAPIVGVPTVSTRRYEQDDG